MKKSVFQITAIFAMTIAIFALVDKNNDLAQVMVLMAIYSRYISNER